MKKYEANHKCESCGADVEFNTNEIITNCIYCGSSIALIKSDIESLNITKLIPFNISENEIKRSVYEEHSKLDSYDKKIIKISQIFIPYYVGSFNYKSEIIYYDSRNDKKMRNVKCEIEDIFEKTFFAPSHYDKILTESYDRFNMNNALNFDKALISSEQTIDIKNKFNFEKTAKEKALIKIEHNKSFFIADYEKKIDTTIHIEQLKIEKEAILVPFYEVILEDKNKIYMIGNLNQKKQKLTNNNANLMKELIFLLCMLLFFNIVFFTVMYVLFNEDITQGITNSGKYLNFNIIFSIIIIISIIFIKKKVPFKKVEKIKFDNNYYFYNKEV